MGRSQSDSEKSSKKSKVAQKNKKNRARICPYIRKNFIIFRKCVKKLKSKTVFSKYNQEITCSVCKKVAKSHFSARLTAEHAHSEPRSLNWRLTVGSIQTRLRGAPATHRIGQAISSFPRRAGSVLSSHQVDTFPDAAFPALTLRLGRFGWFPS